MCGLIGHVVPHGHQADRNAVKKGSYALKHRGLDGSGQLDLPQISLAHRRLSIIDLAGSPQPWTSSCGRYHLVFNGEIYNYPELRSDLEKKNIQFFSQGDSEVLLNLYIVHGSKCIDLLNGMFVFAVWDSLKRSLFIARDRIGKKPLYYSEKNGELVFASELQSLQYFSFLDHSINSGAVNDFFAHQFIGQDRCIYTNVRKLLPAHHLTWENGQIKIRQYWKIPLPDDNGVDEKVLREELQELVSDAVQIRLRSDVPLGAFLSGGLDSSIIAASIKKQGYELATYTIGFKEASYDESAIAKRVSEDLETQHFMQRVNVSSPETVNQCLDSFAEPFADPSALPFWHLCEHTSRQVTVALSGDGVDELFAGYKRYHARQLMKYYKVIPKIIREKIIMRIIGQFSESTDYYANNLVKKINLFNTLARKIDESPGDPLAQTFTLGDRARLFSDTCVQADSFNFVDELGLNEIDSITKMLFTDQYTYLPEDILTKVDRMSMRHGLEVRSPFLDYRIVEFAGKLPIRYKIRGAQQKYLIKKSFKKIVPEYVLSRQKHGFAVPLGDWFRKGLKQSFEQAVFDGRSSDYLNSHEIKRIWKQHADEKFDHGFKLWSIYTFCRWHNNQVFS